MKAAISRLRHVILPAACALASVVFAGVLHALTGQGLAPSARGVAAVACVIMLASLVVPAVSLARAWELSDDWRHDLRRWGATVGGALSGVLAGLLVYVLFAAARAAPAVVASLVVVAACAVSLAALTRALGRLFKGHPAGAGVAGGVLLALAAVPFWTGTLVRTGAGFAWSGWIVAASPFLAAASPWLGAPGPWGFDPRTSPVLYGIWVGTDVPVLMPGWVACAAGHLVFGAVMIGLAEALPRGLAARRRAGRQERGRAGASSA